MWRLFAERDGAPDRELRRRVRRRLRAGRSGDAIVAEIADLWSAARIADEILPDPTVAIGLAEQSGHTGHALYLAAQAGDLDRVAEIAELQLARESDAARRAAVEVLLGETRLILSEKPRAAVLEALGRESAAWLLDKQLAAAAQWDELAAAQTAWLTAEPDPLERAARARAFAWQWLHRSPERAASFIVAAVAPSQSDLPAVLALARLLAETTGDWELLGRVAAAASSDEEDGALAAQAVEDARAAMPFSPTHEDSVEACKRAIAADARARGPRRRLARLLRKDARWRVLVEALREEEATACATPAERASVLREIVVVCRDQLKHELLVVSSLSELLLLCPDDEATLEQLAALHVQHRRWAELVSILNRRAARLAEADELAALHLRIAKIYLEHLGNEPEAVKQLERVLDAAPDPTAMQLLDGLYTKRREWEKLVGLGRRRLAEQKDPQRRREQALELARLSERAKKSALSIECWAEVLALAPDEPEALAALEKLYERERRWPELAQICAREAESAADPAKQAAAWQKLGQLYGERMEDVERAVDAWRRLLAIVPDSVRAQDALRKLFVTRRAWDDLEALFGARVEEYLRAIERQIDVESGEVQLELLRRAAVLYRDRLRRPDRALRAFERMLELDGHSLAAAEGLIPLYSAHESHSSADAGKLARVLAVQLEHTSEAALRQERLRRLGELHEQPLGDLRGAFRWRLTALDEDPAGSRVDLERLAQATGEWRPLVESYRAAAVRLSPEASLALLRVVARAEEQQLGDVEAAVVSWRRILAIDFRNEEALDALERLYTGRDQHGELVVICQRRLELATDPESRQRAFLKIAQLAELRLSDDALAIRTYVLLLDESPRERAALAALDRLYRKSGQWQVLADVLQRQLSLAPEEDSLRLELAALREGPLGDAAGAIALYREVLERDPGSTAARAALERHLRGELQHEAATILLPIYERAGEWPRLAEAYEVLAARADGERLVEILRTLGQLRESKLDDPKAALAAYTRALKLAPADRDLYARSEKLAQPLDAWPQLVELYREIAGRPLALSVQIELRCRLGRLYRDHLNEKDRALATFQRVVDLDANNFEAAAALKALQSGVAPNSDEARDALETLYRGAEKWPELVTALKERAAQLTDKARRTAVWLEIDRICDDELGDPEAAYEALCAAYREDPDDETLAAELERRATSADRWRAAVREMLRVAERLEREGPRAAADRWVQIARIYDTQLDSLDEATLILRGVLAANPDHLLALEQLAGLQQKRGDWGQMVPLLRHRAELEPDRQLRASLFLSVADLLEVQEGDVPGAIEAYQSVLEAEPTNAQALYSLEMLYRRSELWTELIGLLATRVQTSDDTGQRVGWLLEIGQLWDERLGDGARSAVAFRQVLEIDPMSIDALEALERLHRAAGDLEGELAILDHELTLWPDHGDYIYAKMETALREAGAWEQLVEIYRQHVLAVDDPVRRIDLRCSLAEVYEQQLKDPARAREAFKEVLLERPDHAAALDGLARLGSTG